MDPFLPVLTFHALDDQPSVISFSPEVFRCGMAKLHENGYRTMSLSEAVNCLRRRKPFPAQSFVITFDDGYQTVYEFAFPVLQDYAMTATIFLTVGKNRRRNLEERLPQLESRFMLSWQEIREMQRHGMEFGAHTCTHPDLTCLPMDQIKAEICDSKKIIEDSLGFSVTSFAYPYGQFNDSIRKLVQEHFACASSDNLGFVTARSDLYTLKRIDAYYLRTDRLFNLMLTRWFPWYIQMRHIPRWVQRTVKSGL